VIVHDLIERTLLGMPRFVGRRGRGHARPARGRRASEGLAECGLNLNAWAFDIVDFASRRVWGDRCSCPPGFSDGQCDVVAVLVACVAGDRLPMKRWPFDVLNTLSPASTKTPFRIRASVPSTSVESLTSRRGHLVEPRVQCLAVLDHDSSLLTIPAAASRSRHRRERTSMRQPAINAYSPGAEPRSRPKPEGASRREAP
jgi:hypothetical protein